MSAILDAKTQLHRLRWEGLTSLMKALPKSALLISPPVLASNGSATASPGLHPAPNAKN